MKVAITGMGLIGPWGTSPEDFLALFSSAESPSEFSPLAELDLYSFGVKKSKRTKKMERLSRAVSAAAAIAMKDAGLSEIPTDTHRACMVSGSAYGASESILSFHRQLETEGPSSVNPNIFPPTSHNVAGGHVSIQFSLSGPLIHFASGNISSEQALLYAYDLISMNRADMVVVGAWDLLCPDLLKSLKEAGIAPDENSWNCCPLSPKSSGPVPQEAVAVLILEKEELAVKRKSRIHGWFHGGATFSSEDGNASCVAAKEALSSAEWSTDDVDNLLLSANGQPTLDEAEASALRRVFLEGEKAPGIITVKAKTGETSGAAGLISSIVAMETMNGKLTIDCQIPNPSVPGAGYFAPPRNAERTMVSGLTAQGEAAILLLSRP